MKSQHSHAVLLFPLLTAAASFHSIFLFFSLPDHPLSDHAGILIWWGCLSLTYGVLALLLRRPRSMQTVILTAAGGFLLQFLLTLFTAYHPSTFLSWAILLFMWGCTYALCCARLLDGVQTESVMTIFELSVLVLFFAAFGVCASVMTPGSLLHPSAGILLALIALARARSGHLRADPQSPHPQKGRLFLAGLLVAMGGLAAVFCILMTASASRLLTRFTQWVVSLVRSAASLIDRFLRWLLSLLPKKHTDTTLLEEAQTQAPGEAADWGSLGTSLPLYLMLGAFVILVLIILVWLWRKGGFHRVAFRAPSAKPVTRKHRSPKELLLQLWKHLCQRFSFRISYLKLWNTAPGLFVWLERQMHSRHLDRETGETSRAFLLRIQASLPSCSESLTRLADCLDQHYFGAGQSLSVDEITAMRKQFRTELRQHPSEKTADA